MAYERVRTIEELLQEYELSNDFRSICEAFSNEVVSNGKKISAKEFRMYFSYLTVEQKEEVLDLIYAPEKRKQNMQRVPPSVLARDMIPGEMCRSVCKRLCKYHMLNIYESLKTENRFQRFKKMLEIYEAKPLFPSLGTFSAEREYLDKYALEETIEELGKSNGELDGITPLNLPANATIGVEMECVGATFNELTTLHSRLFGRYGGLNYLTKFNIKTDSSVCIDKKTKNGFTKRVQSGVEVTSDVLEDNEESWEKLRKACTFLKAIGMRPNKTCGGHIHIGSEILGYDKQAWKNFRDIWIEAQPLIYMISNRRGEKPRSGVSIYAKPLEEETHQARSGEIKIENIEALKNFIQTELVSSDIDDRYHAVNFLRMRSKDIKTIEYRLFNGNVDYNLWRENILLVTRIMQVAKMCSVFPGWKKEKMNSFFEKDLPEKEKMERFLDLVFDEEREKSIFYERWRHMAGEEIVVDTKPMVYSYKPQKKPELPPKAKRKKTKEEKEI